MSKLYPPIQPYRQEMLDVGDGHKIYLELTGTLTGIPVLVLHGGPGAGLSADYRRMFDPHRYHIIGIDQRGSGRSTPFATRDHNTTQHLLADIEYVRKYLGVQSWVLFGGSWGSTLALLAAIEAPETVKALVLRGIFLARAEDTEWFLSPEAGPAQVFPEHYASFYKQVDGAKTGTEISLAYADLFAQEDEIRFTQAVKAWCLWEEWISRLHHYEHEPNPDYDFHRAKSLAQLECHYINNHCFIDENYILDNIEKIAHIPGSIVHGRYDMVCKLKAAVDLSNAWENGQLMIVPDAGHSASEPSIADALVQSTDALAHFLQEQES